MINLLLEKTCDRLFTTRKMIVIGVVVGLVNHMTGLWDAAEPVIVYIQIGLAAATLWGQRSSSPKNDDLTAS